MTCRRLALIAVAIVSMFSAFAASNSAEAGGYGRPAYASPASHRAHAAQISRIKGKHAAAAMAAGILGVAAISDVIASTYRAHVGARAFPGIRPGGIVVAHNPDFPHFDSYANPCTFERVTDIHGRPTPRVVKVCR